jgi:hypothetical protein
MLDLTLRTRRFTLLITLLSPLAGACLGGDPDAAADLDAEVLAQGTLDPVLENTKCFACTDGHDCVAERDNALAAYTDSCEDECGYLATLSTDVFQFSGTKPRACYKPRCCGGGRNTESRSECTLSQQLYASGELGDCHDANEPADDPAHSCGAPNPISTGMH